jgi:hypothetical protein
MKNGWTCERCNKKLGPGKAQIRYLGKVFTVDVLKCPSCGMVMITEETATGRIAEAEQLLEDK